MAREPLGSLEYESTHLELRPDCERLSNTTNARSPPAAAADVRLIGDLLTPARSLGP
jgi:hypothetical protein